MNHFLSMKTALHTSIAATLLGFAFLASGRLIDAADFAVLLFSVGIVAWTIAQYRSVPRMINLNFNRPVRLPVASVVQPASRVTARAAA